MIDYARIVNQRTAAVPPSGIRAFFDIVAEMPEAISLGVGEPDFVTPWPIRSAAIYSIEDGLPQYTSHKGRMRLRALICEYLRVRYALSYDPATEVFVTVGASEGIDVSPVSYTHLIARSSVMVSSMGIILEIASTSA